MIINPESPSNYPHSHQFLLVLSSKAVPLVFTTRFILPDLMAHGWTSENLEFSSNLGEFHLVHS